MAETATETDTDTHVSASMCACVRGGLGNPLLIIMNVVYVSKCICQHDNVSNRVFANNVRQERIHTCSWLLQ